MSRATEASARIDRIAADTGRSFFQGGAYSSDVFADWRGCVALLVERGYSDEGITTFLRSKHMRWCSDGSEAEYGKVPVSDLAAYLDRMSPAGRAEMGLTSQEEDTLREAKLASETRLRTAMRALEGLSDEQIEAVRAKIDGMLAARVTTPNRSKRAKHPEGGKRRSRSGREGSVLTGNTSKEG